MCHVHKKKSPKHHKKESFKDSLLSFKSHQNLSRLPSRARETERPKKTSKPLERDRARKKKQSDNEKRRALFRAAEEEKRSEKRSGEMCVLKFEL